MRARGVSVWFMAVSPKPNTMPGTEDMINKKFVDKCMDEQMDE